MTKSISAFETTWVRSLRRKWRTVKIWKSTIPWQMDHLHLLMKTDQVIWLDDVALCWGITSLFFFFFYLCWENPLYHCCVSYLGEALSCSNMTEVGSASALWKQLYRVTAVLDLTDALVAKREQIPAAKFQNLVKTGARVETCKDFFGMRCSAITCLLQFHAWSTS